MSPLNTPASRIDSELRALGWLALAIALAYANALTGPFQFDDYNVIVYRDGVHSWQAWLDGLGHGIRPLLKASYTLDWTLGWGVLGFHLSNLLIHLGMSWLVLLLSRHFIAQHARLRELASLPLLVALLFALHPANTEAVTYISGRSAALMSLCYLGGLLVYVHGRCQNNRLFLNLLTPLCFALALLSKETAVTFPFALLLWDICSGDGWRDGFARQWSSWLLLLVAALFFLFSDSYQSQMLHSANFNDLGGNFSTQLAGAVWLFKQWAMPLWLNIDPDLPVHRKVLDAPLALLTVSLILAASWRFRSSRPWITLALAWALLQWLPLYLLLPRIDVANERQLYLAAWPLCLAAVIEFSLLLKPAHAKYVITALLLVCALLTLQRNQDYRSEIALWEDTLQKSPDKARVHNNLGHAYLLAGRRDEARTEFTAASRLNPDYSRAHDNLRRLDAEMHKAGASPRP
jgi:tetratricopeptide (TPR) repeat protein